jgi:hypothetical protein
MADRRLVQRPRKDGQGYFLSAMTDEEHAAFESELARPDFVQAHGLTPSLFEQTWTRQSGLCPSCMRPLVIADSFYEETEGAAIVCRDDSMILQIRSDSERFGIPSPV